MKRYCLALILSVVMSGASYAFDISGLQPVAPNGVFSVFSAESMPFKKLSFEIGAELSREPDYYRFALRSAYGISESAECLLTVPYIKGIDESVDGMEDIAVGLKHRFYDEGKYGPSLAYLLNVSLPSGRNEFSTEGRAGVGFIVSKRVGPFKGNMNLIYEKPFTKRLKDEISFSAGIEFSASHNFNLLGEIFTRKGHESDKYDRMEARFGYRLRTTDSIFTTLGIGVDLKKRSPDYRVLLSIGFSPPPEKKVIKKIYEEE